MILFTKESLFEMKISKAAARFVNQYLKLAGYKHSRNMRIDFAKSDLSRWLFPISIKHPRMAQTVLETYEKLKKRKPKVVSDNEDQSTK